MISFTPRRERYYVLHLAVCQSHSAKRRIERIAVSVWNGRGEQTRLTMYEGICGLAFEGAESNVRARDGRAVCMMEKASGRAIQVGFCLLEKMMRLRSIHCLSHEPNFHVLSGLKTIDWRMEQGKRG